MNKYPTVSCGGGIINNQIILKGFKYFYLFTVFLIQHMNKCYL